MNLTLFFRLICLGIFQQTVTKAVNDRIDGEEMNYNNTYFYAPRVFAKDGFNISLQIHNCNYCSSENGYRELGHTWESIEFGFPSGLDDILKEYSEDPETTDTVGCIPLTVAERLLEKHGGIDWEKTISIEQFNKYVHGIEK